MNRTEAERKSSDSNGNEKGKQINCDHRRDEARYWRRNSLEIRCNEITAFEVSSIFLKL